MSLKRETEEREACPALEELQCCAGGGQWGHREEGEVCSLPASPGSLRDGGRMGGLLEGSQMEVAREGRVQTCPCGAPEAEGLCHGMGPEQGTGRG